jgi:hypothetical protein
MDRPFARVKGSVALSVLVVTGSLSGHPVPDIPVRGFFDRGGNARIEIEIDPRCFATDPANEPYLVKASFDQMPDAERAKLSEQARTLAASSVAFHFEPTGQFLPNFEFRFGGIGGAALEKADDPVMLLGRWTTTLATGLIGYRVQALPQGKWSVVVLNTLDGRQVERVSALFPGESSYLLDLTGLTATPPSAAAPGAIGVEGGSGSTFVGFARQGFVHVLPLGLDHILFVLGLFLLCRDWRPLLWQVTMFTGAHTLTLGLATIGGFSVPAAVVEPVIAASIAVVALENVFHAKYNRWRLAVVFAFGLIHGLGFAGALQELDLPTSSLLVGLLGFNVGVELGQLSVIALAFAATFWIRRPEVYRKAVVIPGSLAIAALGLWWTLERIFVH